MLQITRVFSLHGNSEYANYLIILLSTPYGSFYETRHDGYAQPATGHDEYLDKLAFPFEVLRHHQRGTVPGHSDADS